MGNEIITYKTDTKEAVSCGMVTMRRWIIRLPQLRLKGEQMKPADQSRKVEKRRLSKLLIFIVKKQKSCFSR